MKRVLLVTTSRADYSFYRPLLRTGHPEVDLSLVVSGSHLLERHAMSVIEIERDGAPVAARVPIPLDDDSRRAMGKATGATIAGFTDVLEELGPDLVTVLGDRFEMFGACVAASLLGIPVAHLHGGELTLGAVDDSLRHAMTKLSHLHLVATETYAKRVLQMGEEPWRVHVTGALSLDEIRATPVAGEDELVERLGVPMRPRPIVIAYHPVTNDQDQDDGLEAVLRAVGRAERPVVVTGPNADPGNHQIRDRLESFVAEHQHAAYHENLGSRFFVSLMAQAAAMVGNSSSGLIEAPSFELPVVNVGRRQEGRVRGENVIDVLGDEGAISLALDRALSADFRRRLAGMGNPYGDGRAAERVLRVLAEAPRTSTLMSKGFRDLGGDGG